MPKRLPQKVRDWYPKHGVQSDATEQPDGTWVLERVRDFTYTRDGSANETWRSKVSVDVSRVSRLYYLLEPFTEFSTVAHPYFIFEFDDGSALSCTIEGKRLNGAPYSGLKGMLDEYELGYVWITEKDCLTMPLTHGGKALYLYTLALSAEHARAVCREFLNDTHTLYERPEFYHTLFNNCTGRFAYILTRAGVRAPHDLSWYFPGWSDRYLKRLGIINGPLRTPVRDLVEHQDTVWHIIESADGGYFRSLARALSLSGT